MPKPLLAAFAVCLLLVGGLFGFAVGAGKAQPQWKQVPAAVSDVDQEATFETDEWSYGFRGGVRWIAGDGTQHEEGWPECLTERTTSARILVPTRTIDVDGKGIRPVFAVDCRS